MKILMLIAGVFAFSPLLAAVPTPPSQICVDDECKSAAAPGNGAVKWHPGHYMLVYMGDSHGSVLSQRIPEVCRESALQGLQYRMEWADLETVKGSYDFSKVDEIYDALEACGKRLILQVLAVDFNTTDATKFLPKYLLEDPEYKGGVAKTKTGFIARIWEEPVMTRLIALSKALGARYDSKPNFEGVVLAETATSQATVNYSATAFVGQLKRAIPEMVAAWPATNVIVFNNFIQGSTEAQFIDFVKFLRANRATMGGPDTLPPPNDGSKGERIYRGEVGDLDMRGQMPAMFAVQPPELNGKQGTFTPKQLFDHCVGTNHCSHMFWIRYNSESQTLQNWETGILPFIRANPKTAQSCPANYPGCDT